MLGGKRLRVLHGDITKVEVNGIVNAANTSLLGGGGVDGAIHRAGGPEILEDCIRIRNKQGGCDPGEAVITGAGALPANYVIHTVGPVWQGGKKGEPLVLANAYSNSLQLALEHQLNIVAFPNISTGIYGYPRALAAQTAIETVMNFLEKHETPQQVLFVCFDEENFQIYQQLLESS